MKILVTGITAVIDVKDFRIEELKRAIQMACEDCKVGTCDVKFPAWGQNFDGIEFKEIT